LPAAFRPGKAGHCWQEVVTGRGKWLVASGDGESRYPGKYILHCFLDSGLRRNGGVGSAGQCGVDANSTLALV